MSTRKTVFSLSPTKCFDLSKNGARSTLLDNVAPSGGDLPGRDKQKQLDRQAGNCNNRKQESAMVRAEGGLVKGSITLKKPGSVASSTNMASSSHIASSSKSNLASSSKMGKLIEVKKAPDNSSLMNSVLANQKIQNISSTLGTLRQALEANPNDETIKAAVNKFTLQLVAIQNADLYGDDYGISSAVSSPGVLPLNAQYPSQANASQTLPPEPQFPNVNQVEMMQPEAMKPEVAQQIDAAFYSEAEDSDDDLAPHGPSQAHQTAVQSYLDQPYDQVGLENDNSLFLAEMNELSNSPEKPIDIVTAFLSKSKSKKAPKDLPNAQPIPAPFGKSETSKPKSAKKKKQVKAEKVAKEDEQKDAKIKELEAQLAALKKKDVKKKKDLTQDSEFEVEETEVKDVGKSSPAKRTRSQLSLEDQQIREVGMLAVAQTLQELGKDQNEVFYKNKRARTSAKL